MAKIADYTVFGQSHSQYTFGMYDYPGNWKPLAAVYIITKRTVDAEGKGRHTGIYVGQTSNLSERHEDHHKQDCFKGKGANCIGVLIEKNEKRRLEIEADIRNNGSSWPCNDQ
jgi:hypothetical protein